MTPEESLGTVLAKLDQFNIPYMITGSFASNVHSVPRATYDVDIVVEFSKDSLEKFLNSLSDYFYVSHEAAREALESRGMFNVIHLDTGFKVDLIMRKDRDFSRKEFSRREKVGYLDADRWFASAEDIILAKLEWSKIGDSEKQYLDALNVAKVQGERLDRTYLKKWAPDLGVEELLNRLMDEMI